MKVIISLGSKHLTLEPETEFEREVMKKYYQETDIKATIDRDNVLWIKFSGPAKDLDQ